MLRFVFLKSIVALSTAVLLRTTSGSLASSYIDRNSVFFNATDILDDLSYNEQALLYAVQGIVNKNNEPNLLLNTGNMDLDFPKSDELWKEYFENNMNNILSKNT